MPMKLWLKLSLPGYCTNPVSPKRPYEIVDGMQAQQGEPGLLPIPLGFRLFLFLTSKIFFSCWLKWTVSTRAPPTSSSWRPQTVSTSSTLRCSDPEDLIERSTSRLQTLRWASLHTNPLITVVLQPYEDLYLSTHYEVWLSLLWNPDSLIVRFKKKIDMINC